MTIALGAIAASSGTAALILETLWLSFAGDPQKGKTDLRPQGRTIEGDSLWPRLLSECHS